VNLDELSPEERGHLLRSQDYTELRDAGSPAEQAPGPGTGSPNEDLFPEERGDLLRSGELTELRDRGRPVATRTAPAILVLPAFHEKLLNDLQLSS
jgi:hypothetical protein